MGALANAAVLAADPQFQNMALAALVYTARTVFAEPTTTVNHDRRIWYANQVVRQPSSYSDCITWVMAADPVIAAATSAAAVDEATLLAEVATAWDYLAGLGVQSLTIAVP